MYIFDHQVAPLASFPNLATMAVTGTGYTFGCYHWMAPFALHTETIWDIWSIDFKIRWHHLYWLQFWPPGGATCFKYKCGISFSWLDSRYPLSLTTKSTTIQTRTMCFPVLNHIKIRKTLLQKWHFQLPVPEPKKRKHFSITHAPKTCIPAWPPY